MPSLLSLIWMTALVLVALSFATLAALVIVRLRREQEERERPDERARISKALVKYAIEGGEPPVFALDKPRERRLVTETALDAALIIPKRARTRMTNHLEALGLADRLRRAARGGNVRDQLLAIEGLGLLPSKASIATLHRCEEARDLRIWLAALRVRTQLHAGPDMRQLLAMLDRPGARRSPIMQQLVTERALVFPGEALSTLAYNLPPLTRAVLLRAIGETGGVTALKPLRIACLSPDPAVRSAAVGALGLLGHNEAAGALIRATRDVDWRVRLKASEAIGRLGMWREAEHLAPLLRDRVWWVRFRTEEALRRLSDLSVIELKQVTKPAVTAPSTLALKQATTL